jgi:hypothetical protein
MSKRNSIITVGRLADVAAKSISIRSRRDFLKEIETFAKDYPGLTSEAIRGYNDKPGTLCNWRFVELVLAFLHSAEVEVQDKNALAETQRLCHGVLSEPHVRQQRYERPAASDPASLSHLRDIVGAYALIRRDSGSSEPHLRQELLILGHEGKGNAKTYATYISPDAVCRGSWCIVQNSVCIMMHGYRAGFRTDTINLHLARNLDHRPVMSGILAGIASLETFPVILPVVLVKIPSRYIDDHLYMIGDHDDARIRSAFAKINYRMESGSPIYDIINSHSFDQPGGFIVRHEITAKVGEKYSKPASLLLPDLLSFCKSKFDE